MDQDGDVYVSELGTNAVAKIDPTTGAVRQFPLPSNGPNGPLGLFVDDNDLFAGLRGGIGHLNTTSGTWNVMPLPASRIVRIKEDGTGDLYASDITLDQIWEAPLSAARTNSPTAWRTAWRDPSCNGVNGLAIDPQNDVFVGCLNSNRVDEFTTSGSPLGQFVFPRSDSGPEELITGRDGKIWGTEFKGGGIFEVDASARTLTAFSFSPAQATEGLAFEANGKALFTDFKLGYVSEFDPTARTMWIAEMLPPGSAPAGLVIGQNAVFVALNGAGAVAKVVAGAPPATCTCTGVDTKVAPVNFTDEHTFEFKIHWTIHCTGATEGTCRGHIRSLPPLVETPPGPVGTDWIIAPNRRDLTCAGRCGRISSGTFYVIGHSKKQLERKVRAGHTYLLPIEVYYGVGKQEVLEKRFFVKVVFDKRGFLDRKASTFTGR